MRASPSPPLRDPTRDREADVVAARSRPRMMFVVTGEFTTKVRSSRRPPPASGAGRARNTPEFRGGGHLWIRLIERAGIVVISFDKG